MPPPLAFVGPLLAWVLLAAWQLRERRRDRLRAYLEGAGAGPADSLPARLRWGPPGLRIVGGLAVGAALAASVVGPAEGRPVDEEGIPVVLAVDLSRSMTVRDGPATRFDAARLAARRLLAGLEGPVGLVAFAGGGHALLPPTLDRTLLGTWLAGLDPDAVAVQGSSLTGALLASLETLGRGRPGRTGGRAAVVVLTDGEDHGSGSALDEVLATAVRRGVEVHAVVVGSEEGGPVPGVGARSVARPERLGRMLEPMGGWTVRPGELEGLLAGLRGRPGVGGVSGTAGSAGVRRSPDRRAGGRGSGGAWPLLVLVGVLALGWEALLGAAREGP